LIESLEVLFKVNKGRLLCCLFLFFLRGYRFLLDLDEISDLLGNKFNCLRNPSTATSILANVL